MTLAYALTSYFTDDPSDLPRLRRDGSHRERDAGGRDAKGAADDIVLFERVAAGDSAAFELLFRRYRAALCEFAARYTRNTEMAEDLVHDVFLWIWRHGERVAVRGSVRAYLFGAVRHRALDAAERRSVAARADANEVTAASRGVIATPDEGIDTLELRAAVRQAIASLSERRRAVVTLRWGYQLSFAEIAEALGVSIRTAETTHLRAMDDLRRRLAGVIR